MEQWSGAPSGYRVWRHKFALGQWQIPLNLELPNGHTNSFRVQNGTRCDLRIAVETVSPIKRLPG